MRILLIVVTLLTTVSCLPDKKNKDKDPEPELAGTYQVSRLIDDSQGLNVTLPSSGVSAAVVVSRSGDTQISFRIDVTDKGRVTTGQSVTTAIRKASGKEYDILDGSTRVGSINGTDFMLDYVENGDRSAITARK